MVARRPLVSHCLSADRVLHVRCTRKGFAMVLEYQVLSEDGTLLHSKQNRPDAVIRLQQEREAGVRCYLVCRSEWRDGHTSETVEIAINDAVR